MRECVCERERQAPRRELTRDCSTTSYSDAALPLLKNMSIDYVRVASGDLRAVATLSEVHSRNLNLDLSLSKHTTSKKHARTRKSTHEHAWL